MKHYYEVDGQRRYYIAKKISKKENKESFLKILGYAALAGLYFMWLCFFSYIC